MELVSVIRHKVLTEGVPIRDVARQLGLSRNTIRRYVRAKVVPVPRPASPSRATPAKELVAEAAAAIWASRRSFTAGKQRLTATRLWELLRDDGHDVSGRTVRRLVASFRNAEREVTVPLVYAPGELAQVDFFEVWVEVESVRQKAWLFLMRLMHSGRDFAMVCAQQDTTWFLAAHVAAFQHFAGTVAAVAYDNLTAAVAKNPDRRAARRPTAIRRDGRALRPRGALLSSGRGPRQGRCREPRGAHSLAAPRSFAARSESRGHQRRDAGSHRRATRARCGAHCRVGFESGPRCGPFPSPSMGGRCAP